MSDQQRKPYAVFLGDVALDEYYAVKRWPGSAEKVGAEVLESRMGGMIANAANVYRSYGKATRFSGVLCPGDRGLCEALERDGLDTGLVVYDPAMAPSKCMIFLAEGEHTVFIIDTRATSMPITEEMQAAYCAAEVIYTGFWALKLLHLGEKGRRELVQQWYERGVRLVIDSDVDKLTQADKELLPYVHTLFMNEVGLAQQQDGRSEEETAAYLLGLGVQILVVTLAEKGCVVYTRRGTLRVPGVPAEVADVTGAGDTFCASFTFFYGLCGDAALSARFATYASSRSVTGMGARSGAVGSAEVLRYMELHGEDPAPYQAVLRKADCEKL